MTVFEWCDKHPFNKLRFHYTKEEGTRTYDEYRNPVEDIDDKDIFEPVDRILKTYANFDINFYKFFEHSFEVEVILRRPDGYSYLHFAQVIYPEVHLADQLFTAIDYAKESFANCIFGKRNTEVKIEDF